MLAQYVSGSHVNAVNLKHKRWERREADSCAWDEIKDDAGEASPVKRQVNLYLILLFYSVFY